MMLDGMLYGMTSLDGSCLVAVGAIKTDQTYRFVATDPRSTAEAEEKLGYGGRKYRDELRDANRT